MIKNPFKKIVHTDYTYLISKEEPLSYTTESYQKMIINLEYANIDNKYKVIQFTSTLEGEGKTTTIANLAYLLGQRQKKVLVLDLDLRRSKVHRVFDVANVDGLNDFLLDKITMEQMINHSSKIGVDYIVTGEKTTSITNILTSDKLSKLILELKEQYDYILVDAPPVLAVSDSLLIAKNVDGIINVVAEGRAIKKDVKEAYATLKKLSTPIIGSILTQVKISKKSYSYYGYYEDEAIDWYTYSYYT